MNPHPHNKISAPDSPGAVVDLATYSGSAGPRRLDVAHLLGLPQQPLPWRCAGLAADGYVTVLTGEGGEGKSWLALGIAKGVAQGDEFAGLPCKFGRALIFDAENGEHLLARRLQEFEVPPDGVAVYDADGCDVRRENEAFRSAIERERANLVVIDSLRALAPRANESDAGDMEAVMSAVRRLARQTLAALLVIHHRGKGENAGAYRGSSVIRDQADLLFMLSRAKGDPERATRRTIQTSKCRIDEEPPTRWIRITADAGGMQVQKAEPPASAPAGAAPSGRAALARELLPHLRNEPRTAADLARAVGRDPNDGAVRRALKSLKEEGFAVQGSSGWRISQPGQLQGAGWLADEDCEEKLEDPALAGTA